MSAHLAGRASSGQRSVWSSHQRQHSASFSPYAAAAGRTTPPQLRAAGLACVSGQDRIWGSALSGVAQQQRQNLLVCRAYKSTGEVKDLPIFPLNVVALPHAVVPLMIFEARYRVLFNTLLAGNPKIEDGLVQEDSPYKGSKQFGMCFVSEQGMAAVGTTLEIQDYVVNPDGRMYVTNKGVEKFVVKSVKQEKPVLICEVEVLRDDEYKSEDEAEQKKLESEQLAVQVGDLFRNVLRLHLKMNKSKIAKKAGTATVDPAMMGSEAEDEMLEAAELTEMNPLQLSYWIAHTFSDVKYAQQALLEVDDTVVRLKAEKDLLERTLKHYTALSALESVFSGSDSSSSSSGSSGASTSTGGPD